MFLVLNKIYDFLFLCKVPASYEPVVMILDLDNLSNISQCITEAVQLYGHIDILINNAGISYRGEIANTKLDVDIRLMTINYFAQIAIIKGK